MTPAQPTRGELALLLHIAHGREDDHTPHLPTGNTPPDLPPAHPHRRRHQRGRRSTGTVLIALVAVTVLAALTVWSIRQISTGIHETPHDASLPAAQFGPAAPATTPGAATSATTPAAAVAAGPVTVLAEAPPGAGARADAPTSASGAAAAPAADTRPQTPATALKADELTVPALGITAPVTDVDLISAATPCPDSSDPIGNLCVPQQVTTVGQWTGSAPLNTTTGAILIDGHVDNVDQGPGALHDLYLTHRGDLIYLTRGGVLTRWTVTGLTVFAKDIAHPDWFAGAGGPRELHLVTCGGPLITEPNGTHSYADNIVVTAVPA